MTRVLFTGYAPVHFACFGPLYDALARIPGVDLSVSGGIRSTATDGSLRHDAAAMYAPFGLPAASVLTVEQIADEDFDLLFCANTNRIEPRSFGFAIQIFHGLSFRNRALRSENGDFDRYFVIGPYMERGLVRHGVVEPADPRIVRVGFPKTDRLLDGSLQRAHVLAGFGLSGERPVIFYAPTGAYGNSLETMGEEVLGRLTETGRYDVLVKPHDHPKQPIDWLGRLAPLEDEHLRLVRGPDAVPALSAADVLISDASSIANEYTLLDRPIVFLDVPELLAAAAAEDERLDLQTWGRKAGVVVPAADAVVAAVEQALAEPALHASVRTAMARDLFYNPGHATATAIAWLRDELGVGA